MLTPASGSRCLAPSLHQQCSLNTRAHKQGYEKGGEGQSWRAFIGGEHPRLEKETSQEGGREDGWWMDGV